MRLMGHQYIPHRGPRSKRERGAERLFKKIMAENFPNLGKEIHVHIQEAQKIPKMVYLKRPTLRHIIIESSERKATCYIQGTPIRQSADFLAETL